MHGEGIGVPRMLLPYTCPSTIRKGGSCCVEDSITHLVHAPCKLLDVASILEDHGNPMMARDSHDFKVYTIDNFASSLVYREAPEVEASELARVGAGRDVLAGRLTHQDEVWPIVRVLVVCTIDRSHTPIKVIGCQLDRDLVPRQFRRDGADSCDDT